MKTTWLVLALFATPSTLPLFAQTPANLDAQVLQLFDQRCSECHGRQLEEKKRKGNKQMFLDKQSTVSSLAAAKALVIGNVADSAIIQRVTTTDEDDKMPAKGDPLTPAQISLLRRWIAGAAVAAPGAAQSAAVAPPGLITRIELFRAVLADLTNATPGNRRYYRYLTLHNLRNAGETPAELRAARAAVSFTLNSLSSESQLAVPTALGSGQSLLRFDLRDYGWDDAKWNLLAEAYPYDIEPAALTRIEREARTFTGCPLPIIRADWFVFAATQPPFYEKLLDVPGYASSGLPDSDAKLEQQLGVNVPANIQRGRLIRAAFTDSGVSDWNRMIERHGLPQGGYYWKSYDFGNDRAAGDLIRNPLGPPEARYNRAFKHDGGEIIWSLPNGLQGYLLATADGKLLRRGPAGIVKDPDGPQGQVINGISCMRCHAAGMRLPKGGEPDVAKTHQRARDGLNEADQAVFDKLYRDPATVLRQINEDGERFKQAARRAGLADSDFNVAEASLGKLYARFKSDITARTLASELDLSQTDVDARLKDYEDAGNEEMNSLITRLPRGIKRQNFIADFALLAKVFTLGQARDFKPVIFEEFRETTRTEDLTETRPLVRPAVSPAARAGTTYVNSLGMKFVPVAGTDVLFSVWETRVQDYAVFDNAVSGVDTHPVVNVSWEDAKQFLAWLTEKERREGRLTAQQSYRLPTDAEWSNAVGIGDRESSGTPKEKHQKLKNVYPWGTQFPPPRGAGNYDSYSASKLNTDDFDRTSPVGSFAASASGLFDLGGNVWEWCEDFYDGSGGARVLRGASWYSFDADLLSSSYRFSGTPVGRNVTIGFRCVLAGASAR